MIHSARQRAFQAVNTTLIDLYWQFGEYISRKIESAEWVDGMVEQLAAYIARTLVCGDSRGRTCIVCGNFTRHIKSMKKSHHW